MEAVSMAMVMATDRVPMDKVATGRVASAKEAMVSAAWVQALCSRGHELQVVLSPLTHCKLTDTLSAVAVHIGATWTHFVHEHTYVSE